MGTSIAARYVAHSTPIPPLDAGHRFFEPLWTNFRLGAATGILDWHTKLVGVGAVAALAPHGALCARLKTEAPIDQGALGLSLRLWLLVALLTVALAATTLRVQPCIGANLAAHPRGWIFPALAVAGPVFELAFRRYPPHASLASCGYPAGMLTRVAFGLYPCVLPGRSTSANALGVANSQAPAYGLRIAVVWWIIGMILAGSYFTHSCRQSAGKVRSGGDRGY